METTSDPGQYVPIAALEEEKLQHAKTKKRLLSALATMANQTKKLQRVNKELAQHKINLAAIDGGALLTPNVRSELALIGPTKRDDQIFVRKCTLCVQQNDVKYFKGKCKSDMEPRKILAVKNMFMLRLNSLDLTVEELEERTKKLPVLQSNAVYSLSRANNN